MQQRVGCSGWNYRHWRGNLLSAGVSICCHDMPGSEIAFRATGPAAYVRFHGAGRMYAGSYDRTALEPVVDWLASHNGEGRNVYAYFNNDADSSAPFDAMRMRELLLRACNGS